MTPPVDARRKLLQWIGRGLRAARLVLGSLRVKAGLAIVAAFAAGFTLLAAIGLYSAEQETRQLIGNQQTVVARNVANDIDEKVAMVRDMLLDTARRLPLDRLHDAAEMETFIRSNGAMFGLFDDIVIRLPDGRVVADWPMTPGRRGSDRLNAEHFKVVMATGKPHISTPFEAPLLKTPVIVVSVPVLDSAGRLVSVLSGLIHLLRPNFLGRLATRRIGDSGYFVLTDGDGTIMVHPRLDRIMTHASRDGSGAAIERARNGSQGHYEGHEAKLYAASIVKSTGWALLAVLPQDEAYRPLAPMRARLAIIFVALLAALGVLVWLLMGRLLAPLTALKAAVQAYGAGADRAAPLDLGRVPRGSAEIDAVTDALRRAVERTEATAAQLREERAFSAAIVEHAGTLVLVLDREGRFVRFNRACEELSGYSFAEVEGKFPWDTVLPPEDANTIKEQAFEALARNPQALSGRYANYWLTKARERRLIEWHNTLLLDAGGAMQFMVSVGIDITETRLAQAALKRSKVQLRLVLDNVPALIAYYGTDERLIFANRRYSEFYGVAPHRAAGLSVAEVLGPENYRVARAQFERVLAGEAVSYVGQRTSKDGAARFIEATAMPDLDAHGALRGFFWLALDITQRRKADQARRDSEAQLREAQRIAHVGSWDLDLVTDRLDWSDEIFRIFEIDQARFGASYVAFLDAIHPDDRDAVNRAYTDSVAQRTPYEIVHRLRTADGRIKWVRERCETFYDQAGKPLRSAGTVQDITAQAEAEARLRASEARLRTILDAEPECVKLLDRDGKLLDMNPAGLAMIEADSLAQVIGQRVWPIVSEPDHAAFEDMIEAVFRGENRTLVFQIRGFKGTLCHLETHSVPIWDGQRERVTALLGVTRDITARKAMEDALIHNERHVRLLLDSMPLAVGHADAAERITFANRMYRAYYTGDADPVGHTIRHEIGDDIYAFVQPYIRQVLAGETVQYERSFAHSDGTTGTRSVRYIPDLSPSSKVVGFFALIEDITARKRAEARVRAALAEKEVLLKEIYHRVKNNLQVVSSLLNMQERGVADAGVKELLAESANRVKSMALVHEQLYRSQDLSNISLGEYLKQLAEHLQYAHRPQSARVPLRLAVANLRLAIETAVPLGLIVNELVSNAYKHGHAADALRGEVVLRAEPLDDGRVRLEVSDDGRGLPEGFEPKSVTSLGMQLVVTLAAQLGGELRHASEAGRTSFEIVFRPEAHEAERLVA